MNPELIPDSWLIEPLSSDDYAVACRSGLALHGLETKEIDLLLQRIPVRSKERWRDMLAKKREGDQIWLYRNSPDAWHSLSGVAGFALVRSGVVIDAITTMRS